MASGVPILKHIRVYHLTKLVKLFILEMVKKNEGVYF